MSMQDLLRAATALAHGRVQYERRADVPTAGCMFHRCGDTTARGGAVTKSLHPGDVRVRIEHQRVPYGTRCRGLRTSRRIVPTTARRRRLFVRVPAGQRASRRAHICLLRRAAGQSLRRLTFSVAQSCAG